MLSFLTFEQLTNLCELAQAPRDRLLIDVLYETGCTVSELVAIKKTDVLNNCIRFGNRESRISSSLRKRVVKHMEGHSSEFLFSSRQSPSMTPKRVQQIVRKYVRQLNAEGVVKQTPHLLRYTHIAHAIKRGVPFTAIMQQTGLRELRLSQIVKEVGLAEPDPYGRLFG